MDVARAWPERSEPVTEVEVGRGVSVGSGVRVWSGVAVGTRGGVDVVYTSLGAVPRTNHFSNLPSGHHSCHRRPDGHVAGTRSTSGRDAGGRRTRVIRCLCSSVARIQALPSLARGSLPLHRRTTLPACKRAGLPALPALPRARAMPGPLWGNQAERSAGRARRSRARNRLCGPLPDSAPAALRQPRCRRSPPSRSPCARSAPERKVSS
jgi:hypothetical protein